MQLDFPLDHLASIDPMSRLADLSDFGSGESSIVSCYLDTRHGSSGPLAFLNRKAAHIRDALRGVERFYFDTAVAMIRRGLSELDWDGVQGVAVFARGAPDGRRSITVASATPLDNRLVYSRVPEIMPLLALHQRQPACSLLILHQGRFELLETRLGAEADLACAGEFAMIAPGLVGASSGRPERCAALSDDAQWRLRKALAGSSGPLLLAGDKASLAELADWLPDTATERLIGCVAGAADAERSQLIEAARSELAAVYRAQAQALASAIAVEARSGSDRAVLGYRAAIRALEDGKTGALVIADWDHPGLGLPWEAEVEICMEALRRRTPVILADSVQLREAGGVGALLRDDLSQRAASSDRRTTGLERVA